MVHVPQVNLRADLEMVTIYNTYRTEGFFAKTIGVPYGHFVHPYFCLGYLESWTSKGWSAQQNIHHPKKSGLLNGLLTIIVP